ncbi:MAG: type II toxin-antitoxin system mRNA interferase toxin, RelE/StbE family [Desulfuromonadaceae bacterium]|nr:type II toxin-antitoxin system mRNA interferase toxin, RelE/StbE family [Desulfuromonadaceae bacterium]
MPYSLKIKQSALKEIQRLDKLQQIRLIEAIDKIADNPHIGKLLKGEFSGLRRIRVGSYRVIYEIDEGEVLILILRVVHRKDVYR